MKGKRLLNATVGALLVAAVAGGVAYATIPGPGNVYTACMQKNNGTLRLIDKSLPQNNPMSHCSSNETEITWNQAGQQGPPGPQGAPGTNGTNGNDGAAGKDGKNGADGASVTTASEPVGSNCANGGAKFTVGNAVSYACNGNDGAPGQVSLDALQGSPCHNGEGTTQVSYGNLGAVSLKCLITRTVTVTINSIAGGGGSVTSSPEGIDCPGTCTASFELGTDVTLDATANRLQHFTGWGGDCSGTDPCTLTMDGAKNVTADFATDVTLNLSMGRGLPTCTFDPNARGGLGGYDCEPQGVITASPGGFQCGPFVIFFPTASCAWTFAAGTTVTLTSSASPVPAWFGACAGTVGPECTVTLAGDTQVSAAYH